MTRTLLVDTQPVFLSGLGALIEQRLGYPLAGAATTRADALRLLDAERPGLAVVDLFLGTEDGLELVRTLVERAPDLRVLVLSAHDEQVYAGRALQAGAHGFAMKSASPEELLDAVRAVAGGQVALSNAVRERLVERYLGHGEPPASPITLLTDRELEAFRLFGLGLPTVEVAEAMSVSAKTVETYRLSVKSKLGLESNNEFIYHAVLWALGRPSEISQAM